MPKRFLLLFLAFCLAGCVTNDSEKYRSGMEIGSSAVVVMQQKVVVPTLFGGTVATGTDLEFVGNNDKKFLSLCGWPRCGSNDTHVLVVEPGTYRLAEYVIPLGERAVDRTPFPSRSFTVGAGEVVYIGKFVVNAHEKVSYATLRIDESVENDSESARAFLAEKDPELANRMVVRLLN